MIAAGEHRLVVLDEITYPMNWGWIDSAAVLEAIRRGRRRSTSSPPAATRHQR
jgi:ATP:corrinoid adenosyltransferase